MTSPFDYTEAIRDRSVDADLLWAVGRIFQRWLTERSGGRMEGGPPHLMRMELDAAAVDGLHDALVWFVRGDLSHTQAGLAVWAIGKLARSEDEPLFREVLEYGLLHDEAVLYQALIALDNLEALPGDVTSFAAHETEVNRRLAQDYLRSSDPATDSTASGGDG